jgi:hypothetical protein
MFRYTKQVLSGSLAVLELETIVDGKYVNGVDIVRCDESGQIVELPGGAVPRRRWARPPFCGLRWDNRVRVMLRPLHAVETVHERMAAVLDSLS